MSTDKLQEPPLIQVTNPVTYLRRWWDRVMGKEGVYFSFRIHPLTAFLIVFAFSAGLFSVGRYSVNIPLLGLQLNEPTLPPKATATPSEVWKETAFTGTLHYSSSTQKYFLQVTSSSEAINLQVSGNIDLFELIGKRILVYGSYSKIQRLLKVTDTKSLEVLPKTPLPVPMIELTPTPFSTVVPITSPTPDTTPVLD